MARAWALAFALSLCGACAPPTGLSQPASEAPPLPDYVHERYFIEPASSRRPERGAEALRFALTPGGCSPGPGCARSAIATGEAWQPGHQTMIGFEIRVPRDFAHRGPGLSVARFRAGRGGPLLIDMTLDRDRGLTAFGRVCLPPEVFGQWRRVYLRMAWAQDETGFVEIRCGRGDILSEPVIYAAEGIATHPPGAPARYDLHLGLVADRPVSRPVTVEMRRILWRRLYVVLGRPAGG
ncbi:hypothetical protein SAMN05421759_101480 [Roseivivax lentus]|uniref:Polysaccharide lyase n=1 Tax=Roseivivax lentus TaxID=633194 RepID=A0A1N7K5S6_9RHOB|nr:hypothetical protein [Roseivivax lentus]SIS56953.1 hypothetical protein SAMN05421759_101480 [Roseivivax lentus]